MRKLLFIITPILLLLLLAAYFAVGIAQNRIDNWLKQRNIMAHSLVVSAVTPEGILLRDIDLGDKHNLQAKSVYIAYRGGFNLSSLRLQITASDLQIKASQTSTGWHLGGIEQLWQESTPIKSKKQAQLQLIGDVDITGNLQGPVDGQIDLRAVDYKAGKRLLDATDLQLKISNNSTQNLAKLKIAQLALKQGKADLFAPLQVTSKITHDLADDTITHRGKMQDKSGQMQLQINGSHRLNNGHGELHIASNELIFGLQKLKLADLLPGLAENIATPDMRLKINSDLTYAADGKIKGDGVLQLLALPLGSLLTQALGKQTQISGDVRGDIPFTFSDKIEQLQLQKASLQNSGPMQLLMLKSEAKQDDLQAIMDVALTQQNAPQAALQQINVAQMGMQLSSSDDEGGIIIKIALQGTNPILNRPVNLNINLTTNLRELMRSVAATKYQEQ